MLDSKNLYALAGLAATAAAHWPSFSKNKSSTVETSSATSSQPTTSTLQYDGVNSLTYSADMHFVTSPSSMVFFEIKTPSPEPTTAYCEAAMSSIISNAEAAPCSTSADSAISSIMGSSIGTSGFFSLAVADTNLDRSTATSSDPVSTITNTASIQSEPTTPHDMVHIISAINANATATNNVIQDPSVTSTSSSIVNIGSSQRTSSSEPDVSLMAIDYVTKSGSGTGGITEDWAAPSTRTSATSSQSTSSSFNSINSFMGSIPSTTSSASTASTIISTSTSTITNGPVRREDLPLLGGLIYMSGTDTYEADGGMYSPVPPTTTPIYAITYGNHTMTVTAMSVARMCQPGARREAPAIPTMDEYACFAKSTVYALPPIIFPPTWDGPPTVPEIHQITPGLPADSIKVKDQTGFWSEAPWYVATDPGIPAVTDRPGVPATAVEDRSGFFTDLPTA